MSGLRFKDYYNESTKEKECPPGYFWCPVDKKCKKDKDKKKISDNPYPWDRGGINEGEGKEKKGGYTAQQRKDFDYDPEDIKPYMDPPGTNFSEDERVRHDMPSGADIPKEIIVTRHNEREIQDVLRRLWIHALQNPQQKKGQVRVPTLPRKYMDPDIKFESLPPKWRRMIDDTVNLNLQGFRESFMKDPDLHRIRLNLGAVWTGPENEQRPSMAGGLPDEEDAEREYNPPLVRSVQNRPPDFRSPDIVAKQKQAYERAATAKKKKEEEEKKSLFQQLYDYITRKDK